MGCGACFPARESNESPARQKIFFKKGNESPSTVHRRVSTLIGPSHARPYAGRAAKHEQSFGTEALWAK